MQMRVFFVVATMAFSMPGAARAQDVAAAFSGADANGDGLVSRAEFVAARTARFSQLDFNRDGVISRDDFTTILRFRPRAGAMLDQLMTTADANHDGRITCAEYLAAPTPVFDRIDTNHDGLVDQVELAAGRSSLPGAR